MKLPRPTLPDSLAEMNNPTKDLPFFHGKKISVKH